ncbi:MAG: cysteine rich repeat-containing protein [Desulfococcaceae bacterium]
MRHMFVAAAVFCVILTSFGIAFSGEKGIVQTVADGCRAELESYCKDVTPGGGRVLACLYAYEDKISAKCEYALYDAAAQLERVIGAMTFVANECEAELLSHCAAIEPGEGRLLDCLKKKKDKLSKRCQDGLEVVGVKQ